MLDEDGTILVIANKFCPLPLRGGGPFSWAALSGTPLSGGGEGVLGLVSWALSLDSASPSWVLCESPDFGSTDSELSIWGRPEITRRTVGVWSRAMLSLGDTTRVGVDSLMAAFSAAIESFRSES